MKQGVFRQRIVSRLCGKHIRYTVIGRQVETPDERLRVTPRNPRTRKFFISNNLLK